jgi:hypothetical protein
MQDAHCQIFFRRDWQQALPGKIFTWFGCTNWISDWVLSLDIVMAESSRAVVIDDIPKEGIEHQNCPDRSTIVPGAGVVSLNDVL